MELQKFIEEIESQFEEEINLNPDSDFRENDYFDSLVGMSIMVIIKDKYDYSMDVDTFLSCKTPRDLFQHIIKSRNYNE